jgi:hypothetical protein
LTKKQRQFNGRRMVFSTNSAGTGHPYFYLFILGGKTAQLQHKIYYLEEALQRGTPARELEPLIF